MDDATLGKRKRSEEDALSSTGTAHEDRPVSLHSKRQRPDDDPQKQIHSSAADLPPEILQHIFSFVHPVALGLLLRVCRTFNDLLDPSKLAPPHPSGSRILVIRERNEIWALSRRRHLPGYPRPLDGLNELDMWKLLRVRRCQFCQKRAKSTPAFLNSVPWTGGPGREDVRTIWPFRIRCCGPCIETKLRQETELLLSGSSVLRPGLPFAIFTPSFNYVTSVTLRQQQPPPDLKLTKYHYSPDVEELENQLVEVQALGTAAAEEWFKGLQSSGKKRQDDAERLEQWELSLIARLQINPTASSSRAAALSPSPSLPSAVSSLSQQSKGILSHRFSISSPTRPFSAKSSQYTGTIAGSTFHTVPDMPLPTWNPAPGQTLPIQITPRQTAGGSIRSGRSIGGTAPSAKHLQRIKDEKRAEIERRCQLIDPPVRASVLPFMDAFQAALSIPMPLNDSAWDHLKARLLSQRREAEMKEQQLITEQENASLASEELTRFRHSSLVSEDRNARTWAELGMPSRQKLKLFADEYIASGWDGGFAVSVDNATDFATALIVQVKRRFDASIVEEDQELASRGMVLPSDSDIHNIRRLKLEDMKWLYDESVRPHTERFGKEIFLCSQCETGAKKMAFDGLIQHYAAKHTHDLSRGTVVVYWKSAWPPVWPFHIASNPVWVDNRPKPVSPSLQPRADARPDFPGDVEPGDQKAPSDRSFSHTVEALPRHRSLYDQHQDELVNSAATSFTTIARIRGMTDSLRLYVVIDQVVRSFSKIFPHPPAFSLFADSINHEPRLRALRDLHGLQCYCCARDAMNGPYDDREYWLPQLLDHFHKVHIQHGFTTQTRKVDWTYDLVDLPHPQIIRNVLMLPELEPAQFDMLAKAFPHLASDPSHGRSRPHALKSYDVRYMNDTEDFNESTYRLAAPQPGYLHSFRPDLHLIHPLDRQEAATAVTFSGYRPSSPRALATRPSQMVFARAPMGNSPSDQRLGEGTYSELQQFHPSQRLPYRPHLPSEHGTETYQDSDQRRTSGRASPAPTSHLKLPPESDQEMTDVENFLNSFDPLAERSAAMSRQTSTRTRASRDIDRPRDPPGGRISHIATPVGSVRADDSQTLIKNYSTPMTRHSSRAKLDDEDDPLAHDKHQAEYGGEHDHRPVNRHNRQRSSQDYDQPFDPYHNEAERYYVRREPLSPEPSSAYRTGAELTYEEFDQRSAGHHYAQAPRSMYALRPQRPYEIVPAYHHESSSRAFSPGSSATEVRYREDSHDHRTHEPYTERMPYEQPLYSRHTEIVSDYSPRRLPASSNHQK